MERQHLQCSRLFECQEYTLSRTNATYSEYIFAISSLVRLVTRVGVTSPYSRTENSPLKLGRLPLLMNK